MERRSEQPDRQQRKRRHDYNELRTAALHLLKRKPLEDLVADALHNKQLHDILKERNREGWPNATTVATSMATEATARQASLPEGVKRKKPQRWLAEDVVRTRTAIALRIRTAEEAKRPLVELAFLVRSEGLSWPSGVHEAAKEVFSQSLEVVDEGTEMRLVDLLPLHSARTSSRGLTELLAADLALGKQAQEYWDLWNELLDVFDRRLIAGASLHVLLEMLEVLQNGYLARASRRGQAYKDWCAEGFAHGVVAVLGGLTVPVQPAT